MQCNKLGAVLPHLSGVLLCHNLQVVPCKHKLLGRQTMLLQQKRHQMPLQQGRHGVSRMGPLALQLRIKQDPAKGVEDVQRLEQSTQHTWKDWSVYAGLQECQKCSREALTAQVPC